MVSNKSDKIKRTCLYFYWIKWYSLLFGFRAIV